MLKFKYLKWGKFCKDDDENNDDGGSIAVVYDEDEEEYETIVEYDITYNGKNGKKIITRVR